MFLNVFSNCYIGIYYIEIIIYSTQKAETLTSRMTMLRLFDSTWLNIQKNHIRQLFPHVVFFTKLFLKMLLTQALYSPIIGVALE